MTWLCVGLAHIDERIRPHMPLEKDGSVPATLLRGPGGVMRNSAVAMARLGLPVSFLSMAGDDEDGRLVRDDCCDAGMRVDQFVLDPTIPTGRYVAMLEQDGSLHQGFVIDAAADHMTPGWLIPKLDTWHESGEVMADVNLPEASLVTLAAWCHTHGRHLTIVSVSPVKVRRLAGILSKLHRLFLSQAEAMSLLDAIGQAVSDAEAAALALADHGVQEVILTMGPDGALLCANGELHRVPIFDTTKRDVTGAGDCTAAGYLYGLSQQKTPAEAMTYAMAAGSLAVESVESVPARLSGAVLQAIIDQKGMST